MPNFMPDEYEDAGVYHPSAQKDRDKVRLEAEVKRLEAEVKRLEKLVQHLKKAGSPVRS